MAEQKPTILVVDDEKDDLQRVEKALAPIHLEIVTLGDPHKVLQKVESVAPHLVILDALLPGLSGFDLCKQIKTSAGSRKTKVLILTGVYLRDRYRREAIHQFKADGFVTKPFRSGDLQRLVLQLLAEKLKTTPPELQERLAPSIDVSEAGDKDQKPGILNRLFGRLKSTPDQSISKGFLHTVPSSAEAPTTAGDDSPEDQRPEVASSTPTKPETTTGALDTEKPEPDTVQAEIESESDTSRVETKPDMVLAEPDIVQAQAEEEEVGGPTVTSAAEPEPATIEFEVEKREPELIEQLDDEVDATLAAVAEVVESEPVTASEGDDLPEAKSVEAPESSEAQAAEEVLESDASSPSAEEPSIEPDGQVNAEERLVDQEIASSLNAAIAAFDSLDPKAAGSIREVEAPEYPEGGTESAQPPGEFILDVEAATALSEASVADEVQDQIEADEETSEASPEALREELPIYTAEAFLHELRREVMMCRRIDRPLTLILIRIADLGQIVELFGKNFRPKVLRHVAVQAIESLREVDIVGLLEPKELLALTAFASDRYGGERIISRLQASLGRNPFQVGEGIPSFIPKLRFGMAAYPEEAVSSEELLERAEGEVEPPSSTA